MVRRNINNLRYVHDTTVNAESEEEIKSLLMRVKEESGNIGLNSILKKIIKTQRSWNLVPSFHVK